MIIIKEIPIIEAAANDETPYNLYHFVDRFEGTLDHKEDEDWIRVDLVAGETYDISLAGNGDNGAADTVLKIFNSAGEEVAGNDDIDTGTGNHNSMVTFTPDSSGVYYISAASDTADPAQDNSGDYVVTLSGRVDSDKLSGTDAGETLDGGTGDDSLEGGAGADVLIGMEGISFTADFEINFDIASYASSDAGVVVLLEYDVAAGGHAEGDTLVGIEGIRGSEHTDVLFGNSIGNELIGRGGNDVLVSGGTDNNDYYYDWLEGGPGADILIGGDGNDHAAYLTSEAGVEVRLYDGTAKGGDAEGDTFEDIEHLWGSKNDDVLAGDHGDNWLIGQGGNDVMQGREGDDFLIGDSFVPGAAGGDDDIDGGEGDDFINGGPGADMLKGGDGIDTGGYFGSDTGVVVRLHNSVARGGWAQGDTFEMVAVEYTDADGTTQSVQLPDIENLHGTAHDDVLAGDRRDNELYGAEGNDRLFGGPGGGDDLLRGGDGEDVLYGGKGSDTLVGGAGADTLVGGNGDDTAAYWGSDAAVEVRLHDGFAQGGHAEGDTFAGIEILSGSAHDDVLAGDSNGNGFHAGDGDDVLDGREGNDWLDGGAGADTLKGGDGIDLAAYWGSDVGVEVRLYDGFAQGGHAEGDTFDSIEELIGSDHDDKLAGDEGENRLLGEGGDDELDGREGNDYLDGGPGADVLKGGAGEDDAAYDGSDAAVEINLMDNTARGGWAEGDTLDSIEHLSGSQYDDILTGGEGFNHINGNDGDDELNGREGDDWHNGGLGADVLRGGIGYDTAAYNDSDVAVEINLKDNVARGGWAEGDTFESIENLSGSDHDDILEGDAGDNHLNGNGGDDEVEGRGGNDYLIGEGGADTFIFAPGHGDDYIDDFGNGDDRIDLSAFSNINSVSNLTISQQDNEVVIDLSGQGGGTITLNDYISTDITDADFIF